MDEDSIFIKLLVVGDPGVGKTSLLNRFCYEKFDEHTKPTIGCDFQTKVFQNYKGKTLRVQLWDIAGNLIKNLILWGMREKKKKKNIHKEMNGYIIVNSYHGRKKNKNSNFIS